jgi:F-type H+-transporting ATPase subunit b
MRECTRGEKMRAKGLSVLLGLGLFLAFQGVVWASEAGGHGDGHALNWTDFLLRTLNFAILVAILVKLLKKPISNYFASRREEIQKLLAELEIKKQEAEKKSAEYRAKMASLEDETKKIVSEMIGEGEAERQRIIESAQRQAEYIRQQAQIAVQQEVKAARESLQEEISEMSVAAAEEVLRKSMQADDQTRLVKDFMTRVVEAK